MSKNKVAFEDLPDMMADLLDQMRIMNDRMKHMENSVVAKRPVASGDRELLTTSEVSRMLKVARITVYRMANRGDIPCYRNGKNLLFYKDEITEWVENSKTVKGKVDFPQIGFEKGTTERGVSKVSKSC